MQGTMIAAECDDQQGICWPPLMELIRNLRLARPGDLLSVAASDEESKEVIPLWVARAREELLSAEVVGNTTRFTVRRLH